ncbi:VOC family protein [Streptomyces sp. NPDC058642]|uniref:VOC family protein n=1 Tax=Streptomyces sp. NPDC058642 TaxID=3346572 RepID=UPI00366414C7
MDADDRNLLARGRVATRLPAQDVERARRFYAEKLGPEPIADVEGNYPSKGARGERAVWFRDSEGNLLGVGEPVG